MDGLTRRSFLAAGAGLVVAACSKGNGSSPTTLAGVTSTVPQGGSTGSTVLVRFFNDGVQAAGIPQRLPFGLGDANGVVATGGPSELVFAVTDEAGKVVGQVTAPRHADGLPRPYWPVALDLAAPGIYTATTRVDGSVASAAFTVRPAAEVPIPKPGDQLPPVETPTVADARGVTPICTREPACPLHELTLTEALAAKTPVALLIGTPAYCQTGVCGPVLDILLAQRQAFPAVTMVHAEIYTDPEQALSSGNTTSAGASLGTTTEIVQTYQLPFEPLLYLANSDGTIASRLDNLYDATELQAALGTLS